MRSVGLDSGLFESAVFPMPPDADPDAATRYPGCQPEDVAGFDAVVHLAALSNDPLGDLDAELTRDINHRASVRLARLARDAGVQRFLYASSCSMYGAAGGDDF